jgi:hypothetical protein
LKQSLRKFLESLSLPLPLSSPGKRLLEKQSYSPVKLLPLSLPIVNHQE